VSESRADYKVNRDGLFDVILVDPPWDFRVWNKDTGNGRSPSAHYPTMSIDELCNLPVRDFAAENCALFMWCVWPSIFEFVPPLLKSWGFTYKTLGFEWWKLNQRWERFYNPMMLLTGQYHSLERLFAMGMGYYSRANSEPCLLAVRGTMPVATRAERNYIIAPIREHSRKPDEQYGKIERLYPHRRYLELFARHKRVGWSSWGNQVKSDIELAMEF